MLESKSRKYTHIRALDKAIKEMIEEGKTQREIAEYFGFKNKRVVHQYLKRERKKQLQIANGILPRRKGRLPKEYIPTEQEKDNEIKRLKMENELLRDFLRIAGRK